MQRTGALFWPEFQEAKGYPTFWRYPEDSGMDTLINVQEKQGRFRNGLHESNTVSLYGR